MLVLRCTKKVAKHFDLALEQDVLDQPASLLGAWYAHLFDFDDQLFLMLVNAQARYAIPMWVANNDTINDVGKIFLDCLADTMDSMRAPENIARQVMAEYREGLIFTRTANRSILGTMNVLIDYCWYEFDEVIASGSRVNWPKLMRKLNEVPHKQLDWKTAAASLAVLLGVQP